MADSKEDTSQKSEEIKKVVTTKDTTETVRHTGNVLQWPELERNASEGPLTETTP